MIWLLGERTNVTDKIAYFASIKYQLAAPYDFRCGIKGCIGGNSYVSIETDGMVHVRSGYCWDGPSGPTIDTASAMRASVRHDALYQLARLDVVPQLSRRHMDEMYAAACKEDGMSWLRAAFHFKALRWFGSLSTRPTAERRVLTAPR